VPCYNENESIHFCLESLLNQSRSFDEIILVDNNSKVSLKESLGEANHKLSVIKEARQGRAFARNAGASYAKGTYIVFVDADVELSIDWLKELEDYLTLYPLDLIGTTISPKSSSENILDIFRTLIFNSRQTDEKKFFNPLIDTAACAVKRSCFLENHGFSSQLVRNEDYEFSLRVAVRGHLVGLCSKAHAHVSYKRLSSQYSRIISYLVRIYETMRYPIIKKFSLKSLFLKDYSQIKTFRMRMFYFSYLLAGFLGIILSKKPHVCTTNFFSRNDYLRSLRYTYDLEDKILIPDGNLVFIYKDLSLLVYRDYQYIDKIENEELIMLNQLLMRYVEIEIKENDLKKIYFINDFAFSMAKSISEPKGLDRI